MAIGFIKFKPFTHESEVVIKLVKLLLNQPCIFWAIEQVRGQYFELERVGGLKRTKPSAWICRNSNLRD